MVIYVWPNGTWRYSWEISQEEMASWSNAKKVDLDRWYKYDLNEEEVLACLEALEE